MAKVTINRAEPEPPPPTGVTLELSWEEATCLRSILSDYYVGDARRLGFLPRATQDEGDALDRALRVSGIPRGGSDVR